MRVFLDANVLVSGIAFTGNENRLLQATFRSKHTFVISDEVRDEALEVLADKFPRLRKDAREALSLLRTEPVLRREYDRYLERIPAVRDPKDAHVLAAALASACDLLVTGDRDLLDLPAVGTMRIVRASEALRLLGE